MSIAPFFANAVLNCIFRATGITAPTISLHAYVGDPRSTGTELASVGSYAPISLPTYGSPSGGLVTNTADATWPTATANWTTGWNYIGLKDGSGNLWWAGQLPVARNVLTGFTPVDYVGTLGIQFAYGNATYGSNAFLNCLVNGVSVTPPSTLYIAPYNGSPVAGGTELTTNGASRIAAPIFSAASAGATINTSPVNWGIASGNWVANCTHLAFVDASGNIWGFMALSTGVLVYMNDTPTIPIGALVPSIS